MFIFVITVFLIAIYYYGTKNHDYWKKRNIKHDTPIPLFGNLLENQLGKKSSTEISVELYQKYSNEMAVGYYKGTIPELIVRDLDIIKRILTADFAYFYYRGLSRDTNIEPLFKNVFHSDGDTWKLLRQRLTPAFTTAKLKAMFPLVVRCAEKLQIVCDSIVDRGGECDIREVMARFTTEFIGACGFGIEMDTINDGQSMYRELGKKMFARPWRTIMLTIVWQLFPELKSMTHITNKEVETSIYRIVQNIIEQRNKSPSNRNDFIDLLLKLQTNGKIKGESIEEINSDGTPKQVEMDMDFKCLAAQVFVFFAAGFETSSTATSVTLNQLAHNPDKLRKVQEDIDNVLIRYNNKLCYEAISEMTYLDMAFKEGMRLFPSLGVLNRQCARRYTIPELNVTIDPGVTVLIPVQAIHMDEKYFPNPEQFIPERFEHNAKEILHKYAYLPFGEGPRACIGSRLGQMQSLAGLAAILHKFSVEPTANSSRKLKVSGRHNITQSFKGEMSLKLIRRDKKVSQLV